MKMNMESLKVKTKANYDWDDAVYIYGIDPNSIIKRESKIGVNIYYIGYILYIWLLIVEMIL